MVQRESTLPRFVRDHPVTTLLIVAVVLRIIAVFFARGYLASDDHFLVIRPAADWLNGIPTWFEDSEPIKRGIIYPYLIFSMMWLLKLVGVTDPETVMFVNRALHAAWSLTLVPLVYIFLKRYADERAALWGGLLAAAHFILPFMAVRNLVEVISQPLLIAGLYYAETAHEERRWPSRAFWAGVLFGAAFMLRIQTAVIPIAVLFVYFARSRWSNLVALSLGGALMLVIQGIVDYLSFGFFLSSILYSLIGQSKIVYSYVTGPWWTYLATIAGVLIPPFSLLAFAWFMRARKRLPVTFWATLAFLVVHSLIPQKQERFILPIMPALIVLAMMGWSMVRWRDRRFVRVSFVIMLALNLLLLPIGLFNYSQKARIQPLIELGRNPDVGGIVAVTIDHPQWLPYYYAGLEHDDFYYVMRAATLDTLDGYIERRQNERALPWPTHLILFTHRDPAVYRARLERALGPLKETHHYGPSLADYLLHKLNPPFNHSKESWVYELKRPYEEWRLHRMQEMIVPPATLGMEPQP